MNGRMVCAAGLLLAGLTTTPAAAQEKGKMGLTVSAPSAIELSWHVSERVAFTYSWASTSIDEAAPEFDSTQNAWGLSGSIGAQYNLGTRFAVFAEAGLMYSSTESETPTSIGDRTGWNFGSRTAIGGILYF